MQISIVQMVKRMFYAGSVSYFGDNGALPNYRISLPTTDSRRTVVSYLRKAY